MTKVIAVKNSKLWTFFPKNNKLIVYMCSDWLQIDQWR